MNPLRTFLLSAFILFSITISAQGPWTQKAQMPGLARHRPFTFSIGQRGYLGAGWNGTTMYSDFFEYDPGSDTWSQKASYPAGPRLSAFGFSIGNKGYAGCGLDQNLYVHSDFYEYNPATNVWTAKASWIGTPIFGASACTINNKGYVVCGDDWDLGYFRHSEMYSYNPSTNAWTPEAPFPADGRRDPVGFALNGKFYVGTGSDNNYWECSDWWEFNPATSTWTQKAMFIGSPRSQACGFAVNGKGYLGTGGQLDVTDYFQYDPVANTWLQVNDFPGIGRENAGSFVIGSLAYFVCGTSGTNYHDLWEFNSQNIVGVNEISSEGVSVSVFPNPIQSSATISAKGLNEKLENTFEIYSSDGKLVHSEIHIGGQWEFNRENLTAGTYFYSIISNQKKVASGKLILE